MIHRSVHMVHMVVDWNHVRDYARIIITVAIIAIRHKPIVMVWYALCILDYAQIIIRI
jgi:hypothetical protein